jgi:hypothetical protein
VNIINASKCITYLTSIGVRVSETDAKAWLQQERYYRAKRRAHRRELKKSCGHFRTHQTTIVSDAGTQLVTYCDDCGKRAPWPR